MTMTEHFGHCSNCDLRCRKWECTNVNLVLENSSKCLYSKEMWRFDLQKGGFMNSPRWKRYASNNVMGMISVEIYESMRDAYFVRSGLQNLVMNMKMLCDVPRFFHACSSRINHLIHKLYFAWFMLVHKNWPCFGWGSNKKVTPWYKA